METGYLRTGCGPAVLLVVPAPQTVGSDANGVGAFDRLVDALAPYCRVFVPDADPDLPFSDWLRRFMDGLGLDSASLVADDGVGARALEFVRTHPERVERIAIVRFDDRPSLDVVGLVPGPRNPSPPAASVAPPVLIVSFVGSDGDLTDASHPLVRFLTSSDDAIGNE